MVETNMGKIRFCVVLYNMTIVQSQTIQTLQQQLAYLSQPYEVVVYDNGEVYQKDDCPYTYVFNNGNMGLASCYNQALSDLQSDDVLVLLDQDTQLSQSYMTALNDNMRTQGWSVLLPIMVQHNTQLSPLFLHTTIRSTNKPLANADYTQLVAINSGSIYKVSILKSINGFDERFPVDYLDHATFARLRQKGVFMRVMPVYLEHTLSVMDMKHVSQKRFVDILKAEYRYIRLYESHRLGNYRLQLLKRFFKLVVSVPNKRLAYLTVKQFVRSWKR